MLFICTLNLTQWNCFQTASRFVGLCFQEQNINHTISRFGSNLRITITCIVFLEISTANIHRQHYLIGDNMCAYGQGPLSGFKQRGQFEKFATVYPVSESHLRDHFAHTTRLGTQMLSFWYTWMLEACHKLVIWNWNITHKWRARTGWSQTTFLKSCWDFIDYASGV